MFDFLYQNKVLISISFLILLIINAGIVYYYYYRFTKEKEQKEEEKEEEQKEEEKEEEQKEEVKSSIQYIIYEYKVFLVLIVLLLLTTIDGIYYYNYNNEISKYILIFLIVLIILISIISILYYYYYDNTDKDQTAEVVDTAIIKSLEEGPIEKRKEVLLNFLDKKFDYQDVPTGIFYLKRINESERIKLYENIELKYIEKISIGFNSDNEKEYLDEILDTLSSEDETLLYTNLRKKNILLDTKRDIIGSKLKNIINLLDKDKDETIKEAASILCFEESDSNRKILIDELKKRHIYHKIVEIVNNINYGNASCQKVLLI